MSSSRKRNGKAAKPKGGGSPGRKIKTETPQKRKKNGNPQLKVISFSDEFTFEAYFYEKPSGDEGYIYQLKEYFRGNISEQSEQVDGINLVDMVHQRMPNTDNEKVTTSTTETYPRTLFIRYPEGNETTEETRQQGLNAIKGFLQDPRFSTYPPSDIDLIDLTNEDNPTALDEYFLDDTIKQMMEEDIPTENLDSEFATSFPEFARKCWRFNHISDWGLRMLGYADLIAAENKDEN